VYSRCPLTVANTTAIVCFLAILPLEKLFDYLGEGVLWYALKLGTIIYFPILELAIYCGKDLGDLIVISLNKCVLFPQSHS